MACSAYSAETDQSGEHQTFITTSNVQELKKHEWSPEGLTVGCGVIIADLEEILKEEMAKEGGEREPGHLTQP